MVNERNGEQFGIYFIFIGTWETAANQIVNKNKSHTFQHTKAALQSFCLGDNNTDSPKPQNRFYFFSLYGITSIWSMITHCLTMPACLLLSVYGVAGLCAWKVRCTPRTSDRSLSLQRMPLPTWWLHANHPFWNSLILEFKAPIFWSKRLCRQDLGVTFKKRKK